MLDSKHLFWVSFIILVLIFIINLLSGNKGTYTDHTPMMSLLWKKRKGTSTDKKTTNKPFESKGEQECRRVLEKYTGRRFSRERPSFMRNHVSGHNLELDCFNQDLKLAVEYNGEQHYNYIPHFHSSRDAFYNSRYKDDIKKRLCDENGIRLIVVPYTVSFSNIEQYLLNQLRR